MIEIRLHKVVPDRHQYRSYRMFIRRGLFGAYALTRSGVVSSDRGRSEMIGAGPWTKQRRNWRKGRLPRRDAATPANEQRIYKKGKGPGREWDGERQGGLSGKGRAKGQRRGTTRSPSSAGSGTTGLASSSTGSRSLMASNTQTDPETTGRRPSPS